MEKPTYRDNLERINEAFPNKEILNKSDVAKFTGLDHRTINKLYTFRDNYISKATLAREMS